MFVADVDMYRDGVPVALQRSRAPWLRSNAVRSTDGYLFPFTPVQHLL